MMAMLTSTARELRSTLDLVLWGRIYDTPKFRDVPPQLRRLNDIAFSGDGEPTTSRDKQVFFLHP